MTTLGTLLRERRQQAGLGLRTFAGLIDERASTVSAIETGKRSPWRSKQIISRVAHVLEAETFAAEWHNHLSANGQAVESPGESQPDSENCKLLWWWTGSDSPQLTPQQVGELAGFVNAKSADKSSVNSEASESPWPALTELAIEWRVRQLLGRRNMSHNLAPVDVEAVLENEAGVHLEILPGLVPNFSVQACTVSSPQGLAILVDRIIADSRPLASYRHVLATCYAPVLLWNRCLAKTSCAGPFLTLQQSADWPKMLRDCQRFALALLLPANAVQLAAQHAYQEMIQQQGWLDAEIAARDLRNRLAEQFSVPTTLVQRRLTGWPCHLYGRIAQALAAEETTLPPTDWIEENRMEQRQLFDKETELRRS